MAVQPTAELPDEFRIPLPPSVAGSEYGEDDDPFTGQVAPKREGAPEQARVEEQFRQNHGEDSDESGSTAKELKELDARDCAQQEQDPHPGSPSTSVAYERLVEAIRDEVHYSRRFMLLQNNVQELTRLCGTTGRLIPRQSHLYRLMLGSFKADNSTSFASLYNQTVQLREHSHGQDLVDSPFDNRSLLNPIKGPSATWIHALPQVFQKGVFQLLHRIRTDESFLALRVANLSPTQLNKLALPHRQSSNSDAVLQTSATYRFSPGSLPLNFSKPKETAGSISNTKRDPLLLLLHGVFDTSFEPGSQESLHQCAIWSATCAKVIEVAKSGSDEFCTAILDGFANMHPWPVKSQLELFLMELIQSGAFLLEPAVPQPLEFRKPDDLHNRDQVAATSNYFENALKTLAHLLTESCSQTGIPRGAFRLIHATLRKIESPEKRSKAQKFFVRWYFTSHISNILKYPETLGIMMNYHISDAVRQKILHELALRLQKQVLDALSPWKPPIASRATAEDGVAKLLRLFDVPSSKDVNAPTIAAANGPSGHLQYLTLAPSDVLSILTTLYPDDTSDTTSKNFFDSADISTTSSVNGSSTLTSGSDEARTGTASSTAASVSGTSITSNGSSNRVLVAGLVGAPKVGVLDDNILPQPGVDGNQILPEECAIADLALALARVSNVREAPNAASSVSEETECSIFYIQENGSGVTSRPVHLDIAMQEVNESLKCFAKSALASQSVRDDELTILVESIASVSHGDPSFYTSSTGAVLNPDSLLESRFHEQLARAESRYDFQLAHFWCRSLQILAKIALDQRNLLFDAATRLCRARSEFFCGIWFQTYERWLEDFRLRVEVQETILRDLACRSSNLRDKMWYLTGVRHSSPYSDALNVTRALKKMSKSSQPRATGVTAWARQRLRSTIGLDRAQQQTLEVLAAPKNCGGPSKLSDAQAELTSGWLTGSSVENFCKGEERIHRFCFEVQKCVDKLVGKTLLESPVLWSSSLYQDEKQRYGVGHGQPTIQTARDNQYRRRNVSFGSAVPPIQRMQYHFESPVGNPQHPYVHGLARSVIIPALPGGGGHFTNTSGTISQRPNLQYTSEEPYPTSYQPLTLPPSPISPEHMSTMQLLSQPASTQKNEFLSHMKEVVITLLLSELGSYLWNDGSETDCWITKKTTRRLMDKMPNHRPKELQTNLVPVAEDSNGLDQNQPHCSELSVNSVHLVPDRPLLSSTNTSSRGSSRHTFSFEEAYRRLLNKFRLSSNPFDKLQSLYELTNVIAISQNMEAHQFTTVDGQTDSCVITNDPMSPGIRALGVPRTRLTRLEEVIANCEDRRLNSMRPISMSANQPTFTDWASLSLQSRQSKPDLTPTLQKLLDDSSFRPHALFRDLQYIAAFVPSSTLDNTPQGYAFWTVGLAAITLKSNLTKEMTHRANQIVAHHYDSQSKRDSPGSTEPRRMSLVASSDEIRSVSDGAVHDPTLEGTTLADAAKLYTFSALEGDPTAARELALFHLTHPELVQRVTLPLSRPGEVFKPHGAFTSGDRVGRGAREGPARGGLDPMTFAVAFHWMEVAANAGDRDAKAFLMENGDLGRGW